MKLAKMRDQSPPPPIQEVTKYKYKLTNLISDSFWNKASKVWNAISTSNNVPPSPPKTKITREAMKFCISYIIDQCQYRPGKLRNISVSNLTTS